MMTCPECSSTDVVAVNENNAVVEVYCNDCGYILEEFEVTDQLPKEIK